MTKQRRKQPSTIRFWLARSTFLPFPPPRRVPPKRGKNGNASGTRLKHGAKAAERVGRCGENGSHHSADCRVNMKGPVRGHRNGGHGGIQRGSESRTRSMRLDRGDEHSQLSATWLAQTVCFNRTTCCAPQVKRHRGWSRGLSDLRSGLHLHSSSRLLRCSNDGHRVEPSTMSHRAICSERR